MAKDLQKFTSRVAPSPWEAALTPQAVRFMRTASLSHEVSRVRYAKGVRSDLLAKLKISTVSDLLLSAPFRYLDFTNLSTIEQARIGFDATIIGEIDKVEVKRPRPRLTIVEVSVVDETGVLIATFFGQPWIAQNLSQGDCVALSGKIGFSYGFKRLNSPFYEVLGDDPLASQKRTAVLPIHHATDGLSPAWMRRIISSALLDFGDVCDMLPAPVRIRHNLMSFSRALRYIHFPQNLAQADEARRRLAFDEVFCLQLALMARRDATLAHLKPTAHRVTGSYLTNMQHALPFDLTEDQSRAVSEILHDMALNKPMNRMVLGDVGTGKTAIATVILGAIKQTGTQATIMAPTGVLASQYAQKIGCVLDQVGITWGLLTGATPARERTEMCEQLRRGEIDVMFGTHALLEDDVVFKNLSLVIIDEQHRFGVGQRARLRKKSPGADLLVMTATPIPRSLALTLYGDLTCSYVYQRPVPGAGVTTHILKKTDRGVAYEEIKRQLSQGRQAYIICPLVGVKKDEDQDDEQLIEDESASNLKAATSEAKFLQEKVFQDFTVGLLTGKMTPSEKDRVMDEFRSGKIDVLVSTTVVEVGVDVPNATVMMIEDAERFGLAQLHQLRGRVGRGAHAGTVYLVADSRSQASQERLRALERIKDGFELAKIDLKLRREGDIMGSRQHGERPLRFVDIEQDQELIESAYHEACRIIADEPRMETAALLPLKYEVFDRYGDVFTEVAGG